MREVPPSSEGNGDKWQVPDYLPPDFYETPLPGDSFETTESTPLLAKFDLTPFESQRPTDSASINEARQTFNETLAVYRQDKHIAHSLELLNGHSVTAEYATAGGEVNFDIFVPRDGTPDQFAMNHTTETTNNTGKLEGYIYCTDEHGIVRRADYGPELCKAFPEYGDMSTTVLLEAINDCYQKKIEQSEVEGKLHAVGAAELAYIKERALESKTPQVTSETLMYLAHHRVRGLGPAFEESAHAGELFLRYMQHHLKAYEYNPGDGEPIRLVIPANDEWRSNLAVTLGEMPGQKKIPGLSVRYERLATPRDVERAMRIPWHQSAGSPHTKHGRLHYYLIPHEANDGSTAHELAVYIVESLLDSKRKALYTINRGVRADELEAYFVNLFLEEPKI
jgi:hypothetical protein